MSSTPSICRAASAALGFIAIVAMIFVFPGAAQAASSHSISGETWSSSTEWYWSATIRTKSGSGNVQVNISTTPCWYNPNVSGNPCTEYDSMKWQLATSGSTSTTSGTVISGSYTTGIERNSTTTIVYLSSGTQFRNVFARGTSCFVNCKHTFSGTETY